jgi:hypothetical protein
MLLLWLEPCIGRALCIRRTASYIALPSPLLAFRGRWLL